MNIWYAQTERSRAKTNCYWWETQNNKTKIWCKNINWKFRWHREWSVNDDSQISSLCDLNSGKTLRKQFNLGEKINWIWVLLLNIQVWVRFIIMSGLNGEWYRITGATWILTLKKIRFDIVDVSSSFLLLQIGETLFLTLSHFKSQIQRLINMKLNPTL